MNLITPYGRFDRAAVTERAQQIYRADTMTWAEARSAAYAEASDELRARFNPRSAISAAREREVA